MTNIRLATKGDLARIVYIERVCAEQPWTEKQLSEELEHSHARLIVAEREGEVVGFCDMHIVADDAHINELAVIPGHRRLGAARALMDEALALSRASGCAVLSLEVRGHNVPAIALYRSCGFVPSGSRRGFYRNPDDDAVCMLIPLNEEAAKKNKC
ncbi:MAG: ribosomal protein S18-alanine N-acetyltransferase [Oscillospiraceae bacterium]